VEHAAVEATYGSQKTARRPQPPRHQLEMRVDADPFWMSSVRALTTDLAIRADFDLDSVADLTLAVDEACAILIDVAQQQDTLVCRFAVAIDGITVTVSLPIGWHRDRPCLRTDSFGWRVITTLADDVELVDGSGGEGMLAVRLTKLQVRVTDGG
jgi:serine/threonine-protein kinase RsbW